MQCVSLTLEGTEIGQRSSYEGHGFYIKVHYSIVMGLGHKWRWSGVVGFRGETERHSE